LWCRQRTNIYLEDRQTAALDRLAAEEGVSRAEVIRRILDRALEGGDRSSLAGDHAKIDVTFGAAADMIEFDRASGERGAELATLNVKHFPMFRALKPPFEVASQ